MEKPDKRILPLIALVIIASMVWVVVRLATSSDSQPLRYVELALYVLTIVYGLAVALLSSKLQYSVIRPSVSKAADPQMFMMEVWLGGYACAAFGAYLLYGFFNP